MENILFAAKQVTSLKSHGFRKNQFRLRDIHFALPRGYIMGLIGKNGAGKTTFFDYIMDEKKKYSGEIILEGKEIHENHMQTLEQIGFVSEKLVKFQLSFAASCWVASAFQCVIEKSEK